MVKNQQYKSILLAFLFTLVLLVILNVIPPLQTVRFIEQLHSSRGGSLLVTNIVIFWIVWGVLFMYFLTPCKSLVTFESHKDSDIAFKNVFKESLTKIVMHKKAILALLMLIITLVFIWSYYSQLEWYNLAHGVGEVSTEPKFLGIYYIVSVIIYSVLLFLFLALRRTFSLIKMP
ncbi:hypothetical protein [Bacillus sp. 1P02SD]|uniref:hypothetical protein n=1 Tax=Bacillus sp. 1P02SD TaxID=3132264 RepID=UPI0039A18E34